MQTTANVRVIPSVEARNGADALIIYKVRQRLKKLPGFLSHCCHTVTPRCETDITFLTMDLVRTLVSGKRRRFQKDSFDLDLTYITPRVIAMGFPGEGLEGAWRNSLDEVSRFFYFYYGVGNFLIINLSERSYNYSRLSDSVLEMGFPDLHTCPLHLALDISKKITEF